jgi:hypothetical protein
MNFSLHLKKESLLHDPIVYISTLKEFEILFLGILLEQAFYFHSDYASIENLAKRAGISRTLAFAIKKKFVADGLMESLNRGMKQTCLRFLSPIFKDPNIFLKCRRQLGSIAQKILASMNDYIFSLFVDRERRNYVRKVLDCTQRYSLSINSISILSFSTAMQEGLIPYRVGKEEPGGGMITHIMGKKLTEYGQIKLSAYPKRIVELVDKSIKYPGSIKSPMAYFETRCRKECADRNIRPDHGYVKQLCITKGFDSNSEPFDTLSISRPEPKREAVEDVTLRLATVRERLRKQAEEREALRKARSIPQLKHQSISDNTVVRSGSPIDPSYWMSLLLKGSA